MTENYHFKSKGPSALVETTRRAINSTQKSSRWSVLGGEASLRVRHEEATIAINSQTPLGFEAQFWMDRPIEGAGKCTFEIMGGTSNVELRETIAASMRSHFVDYGIPKAIIPASRSTILRCNLHVPRIQFVDDDTPENAAHYSGEVDRIVEFFLFLDRELPKWVNGYVAGAATLESVDESDRMTTDTRGYVRDARERTEIENCAVKAAIQHYEARGFTPEIIGKPYDLRCLKSNEERHVEVKGTKGDGHAVELTINEVEHARTQHFATDLFVWGKIQVEYDDDGVRATGGQLIRHICDWVPEDNRLSPTRFEYQVPPDDTSH